MLIGKCETCATLREEVAFLRERMSVLQDKLTEMADPLLAARLAQAQRMREAKPAAAPGPARHPISVEGIRRRLADRQEPDAPPPVVETREDIERGFKAG